MHNNVWPPAATQQAMLDFWWVYIENFEEISREILEAMWAIPEFQELYQRVPPEQLKANQERSRVQLEQAVHGDWTAYEENLSQQGKLYARQGLSFDVWSQIMNFFSAAIIPRLVDSFGNDPPRLKRALLGTHDFISHSLESIVQTYLQTKEELIREGEQRLLITLNSIGDAVIATDTEGNITQMNPVAEQLTGWEKGEAVGKKLSDIFPIHNEITGEVVENPVERVLREGGSVSLANHTVLRSKDGNQLPIADSAAPIHSPSGEVHGVVMVFRDQTEERRTEMELRRWEQLFYSAHWGLALFPVGSQYFSMVNPAFARIHGYTVEEAMAVKARDFYPPEAQAGLQTVAAEIHQNRSHTRETFRLRKDGTSFPAMVDAHCVFDDRMNPLFYAVSVQDITERKRLEEAKARNLALEAENRQIQEGSRLKSEFLANMSHELRTPLNSIIGFTELIHDGLVTPDRPEYHDFLGDILKSSRHLLQLINDVLDLSKVEAGKLVFHPEELDMQKVVWEVVSILRTTAAAKQIRMEMSVAPDLGVLGDAARIKQILYNYVSNALKFTPEHGDVQVRVTGDGDWIRIEVEDTGVGIAEADNSRLFVEFQQLDNGLSKTHSGTGLGLALTRKLTEAQGGSVGFRSVLGQGSTFYAILPRRLRVGQPVAIPRSYVSHRIGAPNILVIEDNDKDRKLISDMLFQAGFSIETAATGAQALKKCETQAFDAITLDLILPDIGGIELLQQIRNSTLSRDIPVIVVTVVAERGVVAGFTVSDILAKPVDGLTLLAALKRSGVMPERRGFVLVIDDDVGSQRLIAHVLSQIGFESRFAPNGAVALRMVEEQPPMAVVLDLLMPEMDGFQFLDYFRELEQGKHVPVVVWTSMDLEVEAYLRLQASAQAVILKGKTTKGSLVTELRRVFERVVE